MTRPAWQRRPGGLALTDRALELCRFAPGARLLDLGSGNGTTVAHVQARRPFWIVGLDPEPDPGGPGPMVRARAERLPFRAGTLDGALLECSLSVFADPAAALAECRRVLVPGGRLALTDLYARGRPARFRGCLGRLDTREDLLAAVTGAGFAVRVFEDHSGDLLALWGQMLLERGSRAFCAEVGADPAELRAARCGYFLLVAEAA